MRTHFYIPIIVHNQAVWVWVLVLVWMCMQLSACLYLVMHVDAFVYYFRVKCIAKNPIGLHKCEAKACICSMWWSWWWLFQLAPVDCCSVYVFIELMSVVAFMLNERMAQNASQNRHCIRIMLFNEYVAYSRCVTSNDDTPSLSFPSHSLHSVALICLVHWINCATT